MRARRWELSVLAMLLLLNACSNPGDDGASVETDSVDIAATAPEFTIEAFGVVEVTREKTISLEFPAAILEVDALVGDHVSRGTRLLSLDLTQYRNQVTNLEREVVIAGLRLRQLEDDYRRNNESADSEYQTLQNTIDAAKSEIAQVTDEYRALYSTVYDEEGTDIGKLLLELDQASRELDTAEDDMIVQNRLFKDGSISEKELEYKVNETQTIRTKVQGIELSIESVRKSQLLELDRLNLLLEQKQTALANLELRADLLRGPELTSIEIQKNLLQKTEQQLKELLEQTQLPWLDDTHVVSDISNGVVKEIAANRGRIVATAGTLVTLLDLDSLVIKAGVPEEFAKDIHLEQAANITPLADPDRVYTGTISHISGIATSGNGETVVQVLIEVDDNDGFLVPGFNVDIEFSPDTPN